MAPLSMSHRVSPEPRGHRVLTGGCLLGYRRCSKRGISNTQRRICSMSQLCTPRRRLPRAKTITCLDKEGKNFNGVFEVI